MKAQNSKRNKSTFDYEPFVPFLTYLNSEIVSASKVKSNIISMHNVESEIVINYRLSIIFIAVEIRKISVGNKFAKLFKG